MKVEKEFRLKAPQDKVWAFITEPEKVAACLPGCEKVEAIGPDKYKAAIKIQMGPIKTRFNVEVEATEERPPEYAAYVTSGEEGGRASRIKATSTLTLKGDGNETDVAYSSDINVVGRLGKFGLGVMKKKADSMGDEFVEALREKIEEPEAAEQPAAQTDKPMDDVASEQPVAGAPDAQGSSPTERSSALWWAGGIGILVILLLIFLAA